MDRFERNVVKQVVEIFFPKDYEESIVDMIRSMAFHDYKIIKKKNHVECRSTSTNKLHNLYAPCIRQPLNAVWCKNGEMHCSHTAAWIEWDNLEDWFIAKWYQNGVLHCDDGPAYEDSFGRCLWYKHGKYIAFTFGEKKAFKDSRFYDFLNKNVSSYKPI